MACLCCTAPVGSGCGQYLTILNGVDSVCRHELVCICLIEVDVRRAQVGLGDGQEISHVCRAVVGRNAVFRKDGDYVVDCRQVQGSVATPVALRNSISHLLCGTTMNPGDCPAHDLSDLPRGVLILSQPIGSRYQPNEWKVIRAKRLTRTFRRQAVADRRRTQSSLQAALGRVGPQRLPVHSRAQWPRPSKNSIRLLRR